MSALGQFLSDDERARLGEKPGGEPPPSKPEVAVSPLFVSPVIMVMGEMGKLGAAAVEVKKAPTIELPCMVC